LISTDSISSWSSYSGARVDAPDVDICICTYRRAEIVDALRAVAALEGCEELKICVIVADNALKPEARTWVSNAARELGLDLLYVHAPAHNISVARNACLDAGSAEWIAFLDDDERAAPGWLKALIAEARRGNWDAVLGPIQAIYQNSAPAWLRSGDFHSTRPVFVRGRIETGYTGNVLIRRVAIQRERLRFRPELGRSGGEDVDFFYRLRDCGGRIGFARDALVYEPVPTERACLAWLLKRSFRAGQTHGARLRGRAQYAMRSGADLCIAAAKAVICALLATVHLPTPARRNRYLTRMALHCGVVARLLGVSEIRFY
jgi:succinoglycan biosynthesis protein ExoM